MTGKLRGHGRVGFGIGRQEHSQFTVNFNPAIDELDDENLTSRRFKF
jgi:hypothetical protein